MTQQIDAQGVDIHVDHGAHFLREALHAHYSQTVSYIARGERLIARQRNLISELQLGNHDTVQAASLLRTFLMVHETQIANLVRLQRSLDEHDAAHPAPLFVFAASA